MDKNLSPEEAREVLMVRARTLEECADDVEMDRPDLAYKYRVEAEQIRSMFGDGTTGKEKT